MSIMINRSQIAYQESADRLLVNGRDADRRLYSRHYSAAELQYSRNATHLRRYMASRLRKPVQCGFQLCHVKHISFVWFKFKLTTLFFTSQHTLTKDVCTNHPCFAIAPTNSLESQLQEKLEIRQLKNKWHRNFD